MSDSSVYSIIVGIVVAWVLFPMFFPIQGVWKRDDDDEHIEFSQFGPIVSGKRDVDGGNQMFSGFQTFFWLRLKRRDFGLPSLTAQGFPQVIAKKLNGSIVARLNLSLRGRKRMVGRFRPQKILFDEPSQRILSRHYQWPISRNYTKTTLTELPSTGKVETKQHGLPPPAAKKITKKKTF